MQFENEPITWKNEGIEPSKELQDEGYKAGYKPPAGVFNWFWSKMCKLTRELQQKLITLSDENDAAHAEMKADINLKLNIDDFTGETILDKIGELPGGSSDYAVLANKPQINNVTLNAGNNTLEALGLATPAIDHNKTLLTSAWSNTVPFVQSVQVDGVTATDTPIVGAVLSSDVSAALAQQAAWSAISRAQTTTNSVTFVCLEEKPAIDIPIQIKVVD